MTDRETDAAVAENVMRWRWVTSDMTDGTQCRTLVPPTANPDDVYVPHEVAGGSVGEHEWLRDTRKPMVGYDEGLPHYTSDPAADYAVLERVRKTWRDRDCELVAYAVCQVWNFRGSGDDEFVGMDERNVIRYRPGDYSRAALLVSQSKGES